MKLRNLFLLAAAGLAVCTPLPAEVPVYTDMTALNSTADTETAYRQRSIRAYLPIETVRDRYKISNYSRFENPTGILFQGGEKAVITVEGKPSGPLSLIVHDFGKSGADEEFPLHEGENVLPVAKGGLGYLNYRADDPNAAATLKVGIQGGTINGIFTHKDSAETWKKLLAHAVAPMLDIMGERVQLAFDVEGLRQGCPEDGPEMIANYDRIMALEQRIMGWEITDPHPGNHVHGRAMWSGFMHADGIGAAFIYTETPNLCHPQRMLEQSWGIAHEFGHVNQTRPGMMWVGMTETTNNICSALVNYKLYPQNLRLEHEVGRTPDNFVLRGSRFDGYVNSAVVHHQLWAYQAGPDDGVGNVPGVKEGDPFVICIPLWQLYLYCTEARGLQNFYPDIYHEARVNDDAARTNGELRTQFFKRACAAAQMDLTDFFVTTGMLAPINRMVNDYNSAHMTVTRKMCREVLDYAARFPKADTSVLYYITGNSVGIYRDKLAVVPSPDFKPEIRNGRFTVPAGTWKNAVAFEVYRGDELIRVNLLGLNHEDNETTDVILPEGATSVKAVQWDGERFEIKLEVES